ncbi:MAG: membrane associated rhomboid family serine protease [Bacteroidia bacterium]|jgi:membrane associated rhomboid family serine protease
MISDLVLYGLIGVNVLFSWKGFEDSAFFQRYLFRVDPILVRGERDRLLTSGFLHVSYIHLAMNMWVLYIFAPYIFMVFQPLQFIALYLISLIGGNLLSLYIHRSHGNYSAVGASGAVSGIVFAAIILIPDLQLGLLFIPGDLPAWIFGTLYILYTIFGIKKQNDNIGHEAHLGGALTGLVLMAAFLQLTGKPLDYLYFSIMFFPSAVFLYFISAHPEWMMTGKINWQNDPVIKWFNSKNKSAPKRKSHPSDETSKAELNRLLDKVSKRGYEGLTEEEKLRLDDLSKRF